MSALRPLHVLVLGLASGLLGCDRGEAQHSAPAPASPSTPAAPGAKPHAGEAHKPPAGATLAYRSGMQLNYKGRMEESRAEFERAVELDPEMSEAWVEIGRLLVFSSSMSLGSDARDVEVLDRGIAALEKARDLEPRNDNYWYWLGTGYGVRHDMEKAGQAMARAVELNPKNGPAWRALGAVQKDAGAANEARASFEQALEVDPKDVEARFQLGQVLEMEGDSAGARTAYEACLEVDPARVDAMGRLIQVCGRLGDAEGEARARAGMERWKDYAERLERRTRAVSQNPGDGAALVRLGQIMIEGGKWEDSLEWFLRAIHVNPKDEVAQFYCGLVRHHLHDDEGAIQHLRESEFLAPDLLDPKLELLRIYVEKGDEASSKELIAKLEATAKADAPTLVSLAEVCEELGRADDATRLRAAATALGGVDESAGR